MCGLTGMVQPAPRFRTGDSPFQGAGDGVPPVKTAAAGYCRNPKHQLTSNSSRTLNLDCKEPDVGRRWFCFLELNGCAGKWRQPGKVSLSLSLSLSLRPLP